MLDRSMNRVYTYNNLFNRSRMAHPMEKFFPGVRVGICSDNMMTLWMARSYGYPCLMTGRVGEPKDTKMMPNCWVVV